MYQLYPPFFVVNEETNFPDSWEIFCCKLLNLKNKTSNIIRRLPPESGVDLFFAEEKTAYQCKSIENCLTSGFNITKIKESYNAALNIKSSLGWDKYAVCLNIDLTGVQEANLKRELPNVIILTKSYWINLCNKFPIAVQENFRHLIPIPQKTVEEKIADVFYSNYSDHLKKLLETDRFDLLFYSNRHNSVYRIPVSKKFKVDDLLYILRGIFKLPPPREFNDGIEVSISYSIVFNDNKIPLDRTIEESGINENSFITLWLTMVYSQNNETARSNTMQLLIKMPKNSVQDALEKYKELISCSFINADNEILCNQ